MNKTQLFKVVIFVICLIPFAIISFSALTGKLGANPIEVITHYTGEWALRFLLITLSITPLHSFLKKFKLVLLRRMLGLYAFFYAGLHFLTYLVLDQFFAWGFILEDISERPYIVVGFAGFILLIPLAMTSTNKMMRRLGRHWKKLHRIVYMVAGLAVIHFFMLVKADYLEPTVYGIILVFLLLYRVFKNGVLRVQTKKI